MIKGIMNRTLGLFCAIVMLGGLSVQGEVVERIVAVIGDRPILASELANQVQTYLLQTGDQDVDVDKLADEMLDKMVSDALMLSAAREDSTIVASPAEIEAQLTERLASLAARFPTEAAFIQQLAKEGLTKRTLEKRFRPEIRDQILKQKIINRKLSAVSVSRQETEQFFQANADSLPEMPDRIKLAHILLKFKVSDATDDSLKEMAEVARKLVVEGLDMTEVAKQMSGGAVGPGAPIGGRIGFVKRAELVPEFARAAFSLQPGSVSGPVRSDYGWHIIKSHTRTRDSVDVSQILFPASPSPADSAVALTLADSLYQALEAGANFKELAKQFSDDDSSRATGGELGLMTYDQLRPEFIEPLGEIEPDQITQPVRSEIGHHILKLLEREQGRKLAMKTDFDIIRNMARQEKTGRMVEEWVVELKKKIYVDVREFDLTK